MIAWLKGLFYVPKHGRVSEKVMMNRITITVVCILVYLVSMSLTAYAYFAHSATTAVMIMGAASYNLDITPPDGMTTSDNDIYVLKNETTEKEEFPFLLSRVKGEHAASLGFCKIKVKTDVNTVEQPDDVQLFYTVPIGIFLSDGTEVTQDELTVFISVPAGQQAVVQFSAEMGSCALPDSRVQNNGVIEPQYHEIAPPPSTVDDDTDDGDKKEEEDTTTTTSSEEKKTTTSTNKKVTTKITTTTKATTNKKTTTTKAETTTITKKVTTTTTTTTAPATTIVTTAAATTTFKEETTTMATTTTTETTQATTAATTTATTTTQADPVETTTQPDSHTTTATTMGEETPLTTTTQPVEEPAVIEE